MNRKRVAVVTATALLVAGGGVWGVMAASAPHSAAPHRPVPTALIDDAISVSPHAMRALDGINMARQALARKDAQKAGSLVTGVEKELAALPSASTQKSSSSGADWVPVSTRMILADDYVPVPEKDQHIGKAKQHLQQDEREQARQELRLAEVDASFSRVLMPLDRVRAHVAAAKAQIEKGNLAAADKALESAQHSVSVVTEFGIGEPVRSSAR